MSANKERTFIMVKPDGVQRGLVGKIIKRFEAKGFKLVALKFTWVSVFSLSLLWFLNSNLTKIDMNYLNGRHMWIIELIVRCFF